MKEKTYIYILKDGDDIRYVGKTSYPKQRLYCHIKESNSGKSTHKINWIKSLIKINRKPELLIIDEVDICDWRFWEKYWITQFRCWGFKLTNLTSGGDGLTGYKHTELSINKMKKKFIENPNYNKSSDKKYIIDRDLLYNKYIIENLSMPKLSKLFGCSQTTVFRNLKDNDISKDKDSWKDQLSNGKKEVIQYDLSGNFIKEWPSVMEVKKEYSGNISSCCRGESLSANGYIWRYKNEYIEIDLDKLNYNKRKVKKMDKDGNIVKVYNSIKEASFDGFNESNIQDCCVYRLKTHREFIWRYFEDNSPIIHSKVIKKIIQYDLSGDFIKEWPSIISASKELNIGSNNISMCCSGKYKTCGGYIWKYKKSILT
jgi:hypothetical protein